MTNSKTRGFVPGAIGPALFTVLMMGASSAAFAQTEPAQADTAAAQTEEFAEEIVVQGTKTGAQSVQTTPLAVTVVNGELIDSMQATSLTDVGRLAPNVQLGQSGAFYGFSNFTIRGISFNTSLRTLDPTVALVVDGMAYADPYGTLVDTFDLEAVEILRGPQGVLLGRNATGGAVLLRTTLPSQEFGGEATLRVGNAGRFDQSFTVQGGLSDTFSARLAVLHRNSDGLYEDNNGGTFVAAPSNPSGVQPANSDNDQVREDVWLVRPSFLWEPTADLSLALVAEYIDGEFGGSDSRVISSKALMQTQFGYTPPDYGYEINHNNNVDPTNLQTQRVTLEANWDTPLGLVTAVSGYRHVDYTPNIDTDGTPFDLFNFKDNDYSSDQYSQELRILSNLSPNLVLLAGLYYSDTSETALEGREISTALTAPASPPYTLRYQQGAYDQSARVAGAFVNLDWTVFERLTLSGGLRYTHEEKEIDIIPLGFCTGPGFTGCPATSYAREGSWSDLSPRVAARYEISDDLMAYASWGRGFRSGNFNGRATNPLGIGPSEPETAESIEIGFKSMLLDRRLRLNLAAFNTDFEDIQKVFQIGAVQSIVNAATASIAGYEAELSFYATRNLTLDASFGYTDASYDRFEDLDLTGDSVPDPELARELKFERVPEYTFNAAATYDFSVPGLPGDWSTRVSYSSTTSYFTDLVNNPNVEVPGYHTIDANLSYEVNNWRINLYGRNLNDAKYFDTSLNAPWAYVVTGGNPRSYGVELSVRY